MSDETFTPMHGLPSGGIDWRGNPDSILSPEELRKVDALVIEDGLPVDSIFAEKQLRLLTEPLYSSWTPPSGEFMALANVGLFYSLDAPPLSPDVMLSLGVPAQRDLSRKENRSYLMRVIGKPPDVVLEMVSDRRGGEEDFKKEEYARIGVPYYVIYDPQSRLRGGPVRAFQLLAGAYRKIESSWLPRVALGLTFWEGVFEAHSTRWLRWCDRDGVVIPTGRERAEQEKQRAEQEKQRVKQEKQRVKQEKQRVKQEKQRAERLAAQLRALGIEPEA